MGFYKLLVRSMFTAALVTMLVSGFSIAQNRGDVEHTYGGKKVSINYGRPELKGRDMLGQATPGMVWRFGMNEGTVLNTEAGLKFGSVAVPAGSYSLLAKKVEGSTWHLIISRQTGLWGTNRDLSQDLPEIPFKVDQTGSPVEQFTIELKGDGKQGSLVATWGSTSLSADFTVE